MRYVSYFLSYTAALFASSLYYKIFWDLFLKGYGMDLYLSSYGFVPAGMPEFNWKINTLIWLSGFVFIGFVLVLITDSVAKSNFKKRKLLPLPVIIINQALATTLYIVLGQCLSYDPKFYYMPIFFLTNIVGLLSDTAVTAYNYDLWMIILTLLHALIFAGISLYVYLKERKKQIRILELEREHRLEMSPADS